MTGLCYLMQDKDDMLRIRDSRSMNEITQKLLQGSKILAVGDNVMEIWENYHKKV